MNLAKIIFFIIAVVVITAVVIFLCGQFEQTRFIYDGANNLVNTVTKAATDNPAITATVTSGGLAVAGGVVLDKINGLKQKVMDTKTAGESAIESAVNKVTAEKDSVLGQVDAVKTQLQTKATELEDFKKKYADADGVIQQQEREILNLKKQKEELMEKIIHTPVNVVEVVK